MEKEKNNPATEPDPPYPPLRPLLSWPVKKAQKVLYIRVDIIMVEISDSETNKILKKKSSSPFLPLSPRGWNPPKNRHPATVPTVKKGGFPGEKK